MRKAWILASFAICAAAGAQPQQPVLIDAVAALVDGEPIVCSEVLADAEALAQSLGTTPSEEIVAQALDARIQRVLELHEAKRWKLSVDDEELAQTIASIEEQNGLPPGGLKDALAAQGIDWEQYRKRLREQLLIGRLINVAVRAQIKIPEAVLREAYERRYAHPKPVRVLHLRRIFLPLPATPSPELVQKTIALAEAIRKRVLAGEDFAQLARLYSKAPEADQGGDLGWVRADALPVRLRAVASLQEGEISKPLRTPAGVFLFQLVGVRTEKPRSRSKAYDEVHLRHILLRIPKDADAATRARIRARAEALARELRNADDETFARRAREISQGPSAEQGGDLGWVRRGQLVPAFEKVAFSLPVGATSGVVETPFGLHIIRVVARRHIDPNSFEALRDEIERTLIEAAVQERLPQWIADLRARAQIELRGCQGVAPLAAR